MLTLDEPKLVLENHARTKHTNSVQSLARAGKETMNVYQAKPVDKQRNNREESRKEDEVQLRHAMEIADFCKQVVCLEIMMEEVGSWQDSSDVAKQHTWSSTGPAGQQG